MTVRNVALCAVAMALALGGCTPSKPAAPDVTAVASVPTNGDGLVFSTIGPTALPRDTCGMILWTLDGARPSAILRYIVGENAEVGLNGATVSFPLGETSGLSQFGIAQWHAFINERGMRMDVRVDFGIGFDGGVYLENGLITIEDAAGWRSVAPVAGIAGCR